MLWLQHDSTSYRWDNHQAIRETDLIAKDLLQKYPTDPHSPFLVRFIFHALNRLTAAGQTRLEQTDSALNFLQIFETNFPTKYDLFYLAMGNSYQYLELMYRRVGEIEKQEAMINKNEELLTRILSDGNKNEIYRKALANLIGLYNNKGTLLYATTHHLDSDSKKQQVGPQIIKYYNRSDSLINLYETNYEVQEAISRNFLRLTLNKYLVYGGYYLDSVQAELNYKRSIRYLKSHCPERVEDDYCITTQLNLMSTTGWVLFSRKKYKECIAVMRNLYSELMNGEKKYNFGISFPKADAEISLTESYYALGMQDSARYFGDLYLADSTKLVDYHAMSEIASILAEVYLERDISRSKELLQLSKDWITKSKNEQIRGKLVREGEVIQMNHSFERIMTVTDQLRDKQTQQLEFLIAGLIIALLATAIVLIVYMRKRVSIRNTPSLD